jgi:hypothetical protein
MVVTIPSVDYSRISILRPFQIYYFMAQRNFAAELRGLVLRS